MRSLSPLAAVLLLAPAMLPAQDQEYLTPGDNLVIEGAPQVPAALAAEAGRYTEFRSATLYDWHPTKREMIIGTRFGDATQVHRVAFPGGARTQLTFFAEPVPSASIQPGTGSYMVFMKDVGGNEFFQLHRQDLATGVTTLLTDGKSRNLPGAWSHDGALMAYSSTRRNGKDTDLYVIDPAEPKSDRLLVELQGGGWSALDWSPDNRTILLGEYVSINESYLHLVDAATRRKTPLVSRGSREQVAYGNAVFSKDGKGVYVTTDRGSEFQRLAYVDLATRRHTFLTDHIKWDVEAFDLARDGKTIAFVTNEDGVSVLRLFDTATRQEKPAAKLPAGVISGVRWHPNSREVGFTLSTARYPADVFSLDLGTGKLQRWTTSETGGLNTSSFAEAELVHWKSFDGRTISGFLFRPPARFTGRRPVVVNIHGGPEGQARPSFLGRDNYYLNELGMALIYPNVRGSSGYGKTFLKLDNGYRRPDTYKDIGALLDWIGTQPHLDAQRVLVTGGSYGGHMTLAVATNYSDRICCAVDVVGISSLVTFLENTSGYRQDLRRVEYGDERDPKMRAFLERIAPLNNARKISKPLFVIQGQNDPRVPLSEAEQMVETVRKNGTPVWYLMAKDEGHGFAKKTNRDFQFYATALFMKEFLLKQELRP